ncbi:hypothetical protein M569_06884, partial [Genlisea aurea]
YAAGEAASTDLYSSRSTVNNAGISGDTSSRYLSWDSLASAAAVARYSVMNPGITASSHSYGPPGLDAAISLDSIHSGLKRNSAQCNTLYTTLLCAQINTGQTEAWYSTDLIEKRPRYESTSHLPVYPQRPGEKDCDYYMQTRTCKFGDSCIFHHPIWVPEGGAPNWKEVPAMPIESLPERPGQPDCPYFMKTRRCKFGSRCRFNHPKDLIAQQGDLENGNLSSLPERPSEPPCAFYMKTGKCKFGATCKFDHPKDVHPLCDGDENGACIPYKVAGDAKPAQQPASPALMHNSKGLPVRLGEEDCPFYLKTGSCKYGATCHFNHPDRYAAIASNLLTSSSTHFGVPTASLLPNFDPRLSQTTASLLGLVSAIYPQRPGQLECDFYMKTGTCKYGSSCIYHHPEHRAENVKLTLSGLPRREGAIHCPFYMKTGLCKYGVTCKFDHPPPGEVIAL